MTLFQAIGLFIIASIGIVLVNLVTLERPKLKSNYCEMVEIYKDSGGEFGWPDFRGNYESACK